MALWCKAHHAWFAGIALLAAVTAELCFRGLLISMAVPVGGPPDLAATARGARKETNYMGADATVYNELPTDYISEFDGYDKTESKEVIKNICLQVININNLYTRY